jgi:hypothetical protein
MNGLTDIEKIIIPQSCIEFTYDAFRKQGEKGFECIGLFVGVINKNAFEIKTAMIPSQTAYKTEYGLNYIVEGDELYRINKWLYENGYTIIAQIHSHPTAAYHSQVDDDFPIMATEGGFSIVIPNFGFDEFSINDWSVNRLMSPKSWVELSSEEVENIFTII